ALCFEHFFRFAGVPADQPVEVEDAVEVVGFVLEAAGQQAGALDADRRPVGVDPGDLRPAGPTGGKALAGHRQAALPVIVGVGHRLRARAGFQYRVDHHTPVSDVVRICAVVDEHPQVHPDLVGCEPDALGCGHRVEHVIDEGVQLSTELRDQPGGGVQHGVTHDANRTNSHDGQQ